MTLYIVRNNLSEEIGTYSDLDRAITLAEHLRDEFNQEYFVEELPCETTEQHSAD